MIVFPNSEPYDIAVYVAFGVSLYPIVSSVVGVWKYIKYGPFETSFTLIAVDTQNLTDMEMGNQ